MKEKIYTTGFYGSVKELIRIGIRNKWITKNDLLRLINIEFGLLDEEGKIK